MDASEWELSKENVQPLRNGRKVGELNAALQFRNKDEFHQQLMEKKKNYETQLRMYNGTDPLDPWYRYIVWQERNFPKGGKDFHVLLSNCLKALENSGQYVGDPRYLDVWLKYTRFMKDPLVLFDYMHEKKIGEKQAAFYESWAGEFERLGNIKKANQIFQMGLEMKAEPFELLQTTHRHFQARVARKVIQDEGEQNAPESTSEEQRTVLGALKGRGPKQTVGSIRTGAAKLGPSQGIGCSMIQTKPQTNNKVSVFEENENVEVKMPPMKEWFYASVPINEDLVKENAQKPGKWDVVKLKQKSVKPVSFNDVNKGHQQSFKVYEDDSSEQATAPNSESNMTYALAPKKQQEDFWCPRFHLEPPDENKVFTVALMKIYAGTEEFSVEELQAARYFELKKNCEAEAHLKSKQVKLQKIEQEMLAKKLQQEEAIEVLQAEKDSLQRQKNEFEDYMAQEMQRQKQEIELFMRRQQQTLQQEQPQQQGQLHLPKQQEEQEQMKLHHLQFQKQQEEKLKRLQKQQEEQEQLKQIQLQKQQEQQLKWKEQQVQDQLKKLEVEKEEQEQMKLLQKQQQEEKLKQFQKEQEQLVRQRQDQLKLFQKQQEEQEQMKRLQLQKQQWEGERLKQLQLQQPPIENCTVATKSTAEGMDPFEIANKSCVEKPKLPGRRSSFLSLNATANTKEALKVIDDMWGSSFLIGQSEEEQEPQAASNVQQVKPSDQFLVYEDDTLDLEGQTAPWLDKKSISNVDQENEVPVAQPQKVQVFCDDDEEENAEVKEGQTAPWLDKKSISNVEQENEVPVARPQKVQVFCDDEEENAEVKDGQVPLLPVEKNLPQMKLDSEPMEEDEVDADKENAHPSGYLQVKDRRGLAGILEPSTTIPFVPLEEQEKMLDEEENATVASATRRLNFTMSDMCTRTFPMGKFVSSTPSSGSVSSHDMENLGLDYSSDDLGRDTTSKDCSLKPQMMGLYMSQQDPQPAFRTQQELSMILEESEYRSSSSSGSSYAHSTQSSAHWSRTHNSQMDSAQKVVERQTANAEEGASVMEKLAKVNLEEKEEEMDIPEDIDPFDSELIKKLLGRVVPPLKDRDSYFSVDTNLPQLRDHTEVVLDGHQCLIQKCFAKGAYASVYLSTVSDKRVALKVQKPACEWEFYICNELKGRLKSDFMKCAIMDVWQSYIFENGSVLVTDYYEFGTLLDIVNQYKKAAKAVPEVIVMYFAYEMLEILKELHKCHIIHADVKPDNWLVQAIPSVPSNSKDVFNPQVPSLKLIDFGRAIDMSLFPESTTFTRVVTTDQFECTEMKSGKPWTYQTDLFGWLATVHCLLFGDYMTFHTVNGRNKIKNTLKRWWQTDMWQTVFDTLLNIPSCEELPDLTALQKQLEDAFVSFGYIRNFCDEMKKLSTMLHQENRFR